MGPFVLAIGGFTLIAIVNILFFLVELLIISGVSIITISRLLALKLPGAMVDFFPMAVLFSVMLLMVRMAKDNEVTILRASGIHTLRFVIPVLLLSLLATSVSYVINEKVVPWANHESDELIQKEIHKRPPPVIQENIVFKDGGSRHFYIKKVNMKQSLMENVLVFEETANFPRITIAEEAQWEEKKWTLFNGKIIEFGADGHVEFSDDFSQLSIFVNKELGTLYNRSKTAREMDSKELKEKISSLEKGGISTRGLRVEYHLKKSIPVACFIFGIIGVAYCLGFVRSGKDWWGVIMAICIAVLSVGLYLFLVAVFRALAKDGAIIPIIGAWAPNILYGTIGISMILHQAIRK
jgi:lipopolysaccharide export system permease protein